jgi:hypothetical protein
MPTLQTLPPERIASTQDISENIARDKIWRHGNRIRVPLLEPGVEKKSRCDHCDGWKNIF